MNVDKISDDMNVADSAEGVSFATSCEEKRKD